MVYGWSLTGSNVQLILTLTQSKYIQCLNNMHNIFCKYYFIKVFIKVVTPIEFFLWIIWLLCYDFYLGNWFGLAFPIITGMLNILHIIFETYGIANNIQNIIKKCWGVRCCQFIAFFGLLIFLCLENPWQNWNDKIK